MIDFPMIRMGLGAGVELDAVDTGPRDAPALIFLHGFPESHRTWRHQLAYFSGRFRCIAPDQRGYRGSSKPADVSAYAPDKLTADVFALADALGIDHFTVVGHDWGGAVAWNVALNGQPGAAWDGRVDRAVVANAPHPFLFQKLLFDDARQRAASQYIRAFRDPANDDLVRQKGIPAILAKAFAGQPPAGALHPPEELARLVEDWRDVDTRFGMLNWYRAAPVVVPAMDEEPDRPPYIDGPFPPLRLPTLVLWGMDDSALPPCNLDGMEDLISDLTIERVEGHGHFLPWEAPDRFNAAMDDWLATH